ncbi:unnamed protein product, partial [Microthlaspi erraticum]
APQRYERQDRGQERAGGRQGRSTRPGSRRSIELALGSIELCPELVAFPSLKLVPARLS